MTSVYELFADWGESIVFGVRRLGPISDEDQVTITTSGVPISTRIEYDSATDQFTLPGTLTTEATSKTSTFDKIADVRTHPWEPEYQQRFGSKIEKIEEFMSWP